MRVIALVAHEDACGDEAGYRQQERSEVTDYYVVVGEFLQEWYF